MMNRYFLLRTILAVAVSWGAPFAGALCQTSEHPGKVMGLAFVGRTTANLDKSVAFYKAIGFSEAANDKTGWRTGPVFDRLYGAHGLSVRTAKLLIVNEASGKRFALDLLEFKGVKRQSFAGHPAWEPGATHFSLVVPDAQALWSRLQTAGLLEPRTWGGRLIVPPGQTRGTIGYLTDPDGLDIELLNQRSGAGKDEGRGADPDTRPGVGHAGLVVLNQAKAKAFYGPLLGGHAQDSGTPWLKGDFYDSVVGGHGNVMRVYDETFPEAAAPAFRLNFALIEFQNRKQPILKPRISDIGVGYVGFEVQGLDALLRRAKTAGARMVSGSAVTIADGTREVILRDPDVGGFVELIEKPTVP